MRNIEKQEYESHYLLSRELQYSGGPSLIVYAHLHSKHTFSLIERD
jgi:hypothetical protein